MADECLDICTERATWPVTVSFFDENDDPVTPTAATYRVDDKLNRTSIVPLTALSGLSTTKVIVITSDQNYVIKSRSGYEVRTLTVEFDYESDNGPAHGTAEYRYKLVNLYGVVDVPSASVSPSASASPSA
jgi:hypothetical protein